MDIKLGDIVALKSHPYFNNASVLISGDPQFLSPLMVVVETVRETKDQWDEKTGNQSSYKTSMQCKCIWYSSKSNQFEDAWIHSNLLKVIESKGESLTKEQLHLGTQVVLKSKDLELNKKKSSKSGDGDSYELFNKTNITSLLSFLSPIMQVLEIRKNDEKEQAYDIKTGKEKKALSKWSVKCKWYSQNTDKLSEKFLPIESLELVEEVSKQLLVDIVAIIERGTYIKTENGDDPRIVKPIKISYLHGNYTLRAFDFVENKNIDIEVDDEFVFEERANYSLNKAPNFNLENGVDAPTHASIKVEIIDVINRSMANNQYLKIKYRDTNDKITIRTIKNCVLTQLLDNGNPVHYLTAYCFLRKDQRTFNVDNIQSIETLDISYA